MKRFKLWKPSPDDFGSTEVVHALLRAVVRDNPDGVRSAIEAGADPNTVGDKGLTPLLFAMAYKKNLAAIRALVECGADPNFSPPGAPRPMGLAAKDENGELLRLFLELGSSPDPVDPEEEPYTATAIYAECFENFRSLLDAGADLDAMVGPESPLVGFLIELDHWALAADLLKRGANRELVLASGVTRPELEQFATSLSSVDRVAFDEVVELLGASRSEVHEDECEGLPKRMKETPMSDDPAVELISTLIESLDHDELEDGWESVAFVLTLDDGRVVQGPGFSYGPGNVVSPVAADPWDSKEAVNAYLSSYFPSGSALSGKVLVQYDRASGKYEITFEDKDSSRWQVTPANVDVVREELRPNLACWPGKESEF